MANGLWVQQGFPLKPDFLRALLSYYETRAETVDFLKPEALPTPSTLGSRSRRRGLSRSSSKRATSTRRRASRW
jgi:hypothetical protein